MAFKSLFIAYAPDVDPDKHHKKIIILKVLYLLTLINLSSIFIITLFFFLLENIDEKK